MRQVSTAAYTENEFEQCVLETIKAAGGRMGLDRLRRVICARFGCDPEFIVLDKMVQIGNRHYMHDDGMVSLLEWKD